MIQEGREDRDTKIESAGGFDVKYVTCAFRLLNGDAQMLSQYHGID